MLRFNFTFLNAVTLTLSILLFVPSAWAEPDNVKLEVPGAQNRGKILNGRLARLEQVPWSVAVARYVATAPNPFIYYCSGTLIGKRWVLTAAHCVLFPKDENEENSSGRKYSVALAKEQLRDFSDHRMVDRIYVPTLFQPNSPANGYDLALLRLERDYDVAACPFSDTNEYTPPCFPQLGGLGAPDPDQSTLEYQIAGFGRLRADAGPAAHLHLAEVPSLRRSVCGTEEIWAREIPDRQLCAGSTNSTDTANPCDGDSGGGAIYFPTVTIPPQLVGIVSMEGISRNTFIDQQPASCDPQNKKRVGIYTAVGFFAESIRQCINNESVCKENGLHSINK